MKGVVVAVTIAVIAFALEGNSQDVTITASVQGNQELGGVINITCNLQTPSGISLNYLGLSNVSDGSNIYLYDNAELRDVKTGNLFKQENMRFFIMTATNAERENTLEISNLDCSYVKKTFYCVADYFVQSTKKKFSSTEVSIKVPPQPPSSLTLSSSPSRGLTNTESVAEGDTVNVVCSANVGMKGGIRWKLYRKNVEEVVPADDSRVTTRQAGLLAGEPPCSERLESTFSMTVRKEDQELVIACFVINQDYNPTMPATCEDEARDFCKQTETIRIHYGVKEETMILNIEHQSGQGTVYQGDTVTLTCTADGFPTPTYSWAKDNSNQTWDGEISQNVNRLVLSEVDIGRDMGRYNCTASNGVFGVVYSFTKDLYLNVEETTTTSTTTTTTPPTTEPSPTPDSSKSDDDDDMLPILLGVIIPVVVILIIIIVVIILCRRQPKKEIEEPSEKPYNNRNVLSFQNPAPDLVADEKNFHNSSLNNSFDVNNEDGLKYADMTYDNRPRSRKPMAIDDTASDYSNIAMPEV